MIFLAAYHWCKNMRLFVAVNIPDGPKENILEIQDRLKSALSDVKWVSGDKLHLTLKFLGEVPENEVAGLCPALERSLAGHKAFRVFVSGTGAFPDNSHPRVVWAGITEGSDELVKLAGALDHNLEGLGYKKEKRSFSPHLTLGRVRSSNNISALVKKIIALENEPAGGFEVSSLDLMSSVLDPKGSQYKCLKSISI